MRSTHRTKKQKNARVPKGIDMKGSMNMVIPGTNQKYSASAGVIAHPMKDKKLSPY